MRLHSVLLLYFLLMPLMLCGSAAAVAAQSGAAQAGPARFAVASFSLDGFSSVDDYPLDLNAIRKTLAEERARYPTAMTADEMHEVADAITRYMRGLGFIFHTVYLPPQRVDRGVVQLKLREGVLTDVHVINETRWPDRRFKKQFNPLLGKLLYGPRIEERVQALKGQAGVRVFAFYSRGQNPGDARLNLRVEPASKRSYSLKADNHGSAASGRHRVIAQVTEYQLTGNFDRLSLAVLRALDGVDNTYGSLSYSLPFARLDYLWDISVSNNQFALGDRFAALGLRGDATTLRTGLSKQLDHHPARRASLRLGVHEKRSNLNMQRSMVEQETSQAATLEWFKALQLPELGIILNGSAGLSYGRFFAGNNLAEEFEKFDLSASALRGIGQDRWRSLLQTSLRGQYTKTQLPSVERFALTGSYGVRGFDPGLFNADAAVLATAEWSLPNLVVSRGETPWRLEPLLLVDYGLGSRLTQTGASGDEASFTAVGAGLRFAWGRHFSGQATVAKPVSGQLNNSDVGADTVWLFDFRWH